MKIIDTCIKMQRDQLVLRCVWEVSIRMCVASKRANAHKRAEIHITQCSTCSSCGSHTLTLTRTLTRTNGSQGCLASCAQCLQLGSLAGPPVTKQVDARRRTEESTRRIKELEGLQLITPITRNRKDWWNISYLRKCTIKKINKVFERKWGYQRYFLMRTSSEIA